MSIVDVISNDCEDLPDFQANLITAAFVVRSRRSPGNIALVHPGGQETYGELEMRSRALAARVSAMGVKAGSKVAILAERGAPLIRSVLAVSRLGAVFIILDANYPDERLETLAGICEPDAFIHTGGALAGRAARLADARGLPLIDGGEVSYALSDDVPGLDQGSPDAPAYFLFTSGSTGRPKCVACSHVPLSHFVEWQSDAFGLTQQDRFTQLSGLSHDPFLRDVFTPLSIGATVLIPEPATITNPAALAPWFRETRATISHLTPALGQILVAGRSREKQLPDLRRLFWGGDQLRRPLVKEAAEIAPRAEQINFYGSTETPQAAAFHRVKASAPPDEVLPIGVGSHGFQLLVVDEVGARLGAGEIGEIVVQSDYLSLGYVEHGRVVAASGRGTRGAGAADVYFTGDRGFCADDGAVVVVGRADDQVKIRGYRVELSEVTAALLDHPAVTSAIALPVGEGASIRIVGFVASDDKAVQDPELLRTFLAGRLPAYMVPGELVVRERLPMLPNGKLDRRAMIDSVTGPAPDIAAGSESAELEGAERALVGSWSGLFPGKRVTRETSFVALGGDSLSYVQAYLATEEAIGVVPSGWEALPISELAAVRKPRSRWWSVIDTSMLLRAISIVAVVAGHFIPAVQTTGATTALMIVSGFMFGNLQMRDAFKKRTPAPIVGAMVRIIIPTFIYAAFIYSQKILRGYPTTIQILFLNNDLFDYAPVIANGGNLQDYQIHLWYVDALIKIIFISYLLFYALKYLLKENFTEKFFFSFLFAIGCVGRFLFPIIGKAVVFGHQIPDMTTYTFVFSSHISTFALGMMCSAFSENKERIVVLFVGLAYALGTGVYYGLPHGIAVVLAILALLRFSRVTIPRPMSQIVFLLSGASLFIYLLHFTFAGAVKRLVGPHHEGLRVLGALVGGILVWKAWIWALALVASQRRRAWPLGGLARR